MNKNNLPTHPNFSDLEEEMLAYWQKDNTFEKSISQKPIDKTYVFYDGPPFATGLPHYGHLLASTTKDVIPRYWTMKGYRVNRVWGWDCHGLPIENMIEKELDIKGGKKGIEQLGIDKFNAACRREVLKLDKEWEKIISRYGRWVDFKNNYKSMDNSFMESVWWGFKELFKKDLVYQGKKVVLYCPRCSTPLSNFEIAMDNSYQDTEDPSIIVKFKAVQTSSINTFHQIEENEYFLAWTTTPWTLPGNVALAVLAEADYSLIKIKNEKYWLAKSKIKDVINDKFEIIKTIKGKNLVGLTYEPLYPYLQNHRTKTTWSILPAKFVSLEEGTGIVHTAAVFGEDDYALAQEFDLPCTATLNEEGHFLPKVELVANKFFKAADKIIIHNLNDKNNLFSSNKIIHSYPFCYRCSTPLYYNAVPAWFINVQKMKKDLINNNQKINWFPAHLKKGRFGKGLASAPDWNISRTRYWGTPMPIWSNPLSNKQTSEKSTKYRVIGSLEELKKWAVNPKLVDNLSDLHREFLDSIEVWIDDEKTIKGQRITEVFDCWVESGSMPFASKHYPFKNKTEFENNYPAQFVSEYIAQTRAWFYTMHVISTGIFNSPSFENVLATGTIMAEDGNKMSKSKKNFPDPMKIINDIGADSLRLYLMSSSVMKGENFNFTQKEVDDIRKKVFLIWWNMFAFYNLYAQNKPVDLDKAVIATDVMDKWVLSKLNSVIKEVTTNMDQYNVVKASRCLMEFINELSTWYLRRSRERLKNNNDLVSLHIFGQVLKTTALLFAPITPFFSDWIFQFLTKQKKGSVHLQNWPQSNPDSIDLNLEKRMISIKSVVERAHSLRSEAGIKVRQPLSKIIVSDESAKPDSHLLEVLKDEINVKAVEWQKRSGNLEVVLDTNLNQVLIEEGEAREIIRNIQKLRKKEHLTIETKIELSLPNWPKNWQTEIEQKTNSQLKKGQEFKIIS